MVMLYNNANSVLRQRVKLYDDCITRPHIGRYYDWKMANDPDPEIKGDYEIDARGSTALIERDIQNQALLNLANITNNARYIPHLKERAELSAILKAFKVNPDELMKTEDEYAQFMQQQAQAAPQQDPRIAAAQMKSQTEMAKLEDNKAQREFEAQKEQGEYEIAMTGAAITRDLGIAKLEQDGTLTREEIAAKERLASLEINNERELFNAEAALKVNQGSGI
jgi:hypothetical protein